MSKRGLVYVRPAKPDDSKAFLDWSLETPNNEFDPQVARTPTTIVLCAYDKDGPLAYQPVQKVFMMDSFAHRPGNTHLQNAEALKNLFQATVTEAHCQGVNEIYFLSTEPGTDKLTKNHAFEELPYRVFRVKLTDLEGQ